MGMVECGLRVSLNPLAPTLRLDGRQLRALPFGQDI